MKVEISVVHTLGEEEKVLANKLITWLMSETVKPEQVSALAQAGATLRQEATDVKDKLNKETK